MILFLQSHNFGKCSHLIFLYITGYNDNSWRSNDPSRLHHKICGSHATTHTPGLKPMPRDWGHRFKYWWWNIADILVSFNSTVRAPEH